MTVKEIKLVSKIFEAAIQYSRDVVNEEFDKDYEFTDDILGNILERLDVGDSAANELINSFGDK